MTARKNSKKQQEADAAYNRVWQIDLEDAIAQEARSGPIPEKQGVGPIAVVERVPDACPRCGEGVPTGRLELWTHMLKRDTGPHRIQCGNCSEVVWCTEQVWKEVRRTNAARFGASDVKPPKVRRSKRERGAE